MNDADGRFETYLEHAGPAMEGWSFAAMTASGRMSEDPLPWSYGSLVIPLMSGADSMLDMGTGGGELLSSLHPLPPNTHATEGWSPNISIARDRLEPLGITVHAFENEDEPLPFEDASLDLIVNRHEAYNPVEVRRVLRPGGLFITQQVGGQNDIDLNDLLEAPPEIDYTDWSLQRAVAELKAAGMHVLDQREAFPATHFYDIGALVFYLSATPWHIEEFSVERYRVRLYDIHLLIESQGWLEVGGHRFLVQAQRPE